MQRLARWAAAQCVLRCFTIINPLPTPAHLLCRRQGACHQLRQGRLDAWPQLLEEAGKPRVHGSAPQRLYAAGLVVGEVDRPLCRRLGAAHRHHQLGAAAVEQHGGKGQDHCAGVGAGGRAPRVAGWLGHVEHGGELPAGGRLPGCGAVGYDAAQGALEVEQRAVQPVGWGGVGGEAVEESRREG